MDFTKIGEAKNKRDLLGLILLGSAFSVLTWAYWNTLQEVAVWWDNPKYSHGYLVPAFTVALLWLRREQTAVVWDLLDTVGTVVAGLGVGAAFATAALPDSWHLSGDTYSNLQLAAILLSVWGAVILVRPKFDLSRVSWQAMATGLALIAAGMGFRLYATLHSMNVPEMYSMLLSALGVFTVLGGWRGLLWAGPAVLFLVFMFPLPSRLDSISGSLQKVSTQCSTYALQTMGIAADSHGTTIEVGQQLLNVVEACSGLRMLTIFMALSVFVALVTDRPLWERMVIVISSVPIAILVNVVRITVTGVMYEYTDPELAQRVFHDLAGYVMMPMALGLLFLEFQVLSHLFVEDEEVVDSLSLDEDLTEHSLK